MSKISKTPQSIRQETRLIHGKQHTSAWNFENHLIPPITSNTTYRLGSVQRGAQGFADFGDVDRKDEKIWVYDRLDEPNTIMLEDQLAYLESGDCAVSFGSGMGAISALCMSVLKAGDEVISDPTIYGCTHSLFTNWLPKFNIKTQWEDLSNIDFLSRISDKTRLIYFESVANPTLKIPPIKEIIKKVKEINSSRTEENKILIAIDNTFATPLGCKPLELGADFVIQSLTKNIAGFGTELGGAVICKKEWEITLKVARKDFGAVLNSKSSWQILTHGLPTLSLRFFKQQESALKIAKKLKENSKVKDVFYPGLETHPTYENAKENLLTKDNQINGGFMIAFNLEGSIEETMAFVDEIAKNSYSITLAVSLGLVKTLIEVPRLMTHSALDEAASKTGEISTQLIRLSIGLENPEDIINDIEEAIGKVF